MVNSLKQLTFEETLKRINLPTLEQEGKRKSLQSDEWCRSIKHKLSIGMG